MHRPAADLTPFLLAPQELRALFAPTTLAHGQAYARKGRVLRYEINDRGVLEAATRGSQPRPYHQVISVAAGRSSPAGLLGLCTCPVGQNCKHVAAVLTVVMQDHGQVGPGAVPKVQPAAPPAAPPALPLLVAAWLRDLPAAARQAPEPPSRDKLFYILAPSDPARGMRRLTASVVTVNIRKDGQLGATRPYELRRVDSPARFLSGADRLILRRLARISPRGSALCEDDVPAELLRRMLATGRAVWSSVDGVALREAPPREGQLTWRLTAEAEQVPDVALPDDALAVFVDGPWYVDAASGEIGPVSTGAIPAPLVAALLAAPAIPPEAAAQVAEALRRQAPALPPLVPVSAPELISGPPTRRLILTVMQLPQYLNLRYGGHQPAPPMEEPVALLRLGYGPFVLPPGFSPLPQRLVRDGKPYLLHRDRQAEVLAATRLEQAGLRKSWHPSAFSRDADDEGRYILDHGPGEAGWLDFILDEMPSLIAEGWDVTLAPDFPVRLVTPEEEVEPRLREGSGIDWFELDLGVVVDGERIDLVPPLLTLIAQGNGRELIAHHPDEEPLLVPLADGRLLRLAIARLRPTLQVLADLFDEGRIGGTDPALRFGRQDAAELLALEEASGLAWVGGDALRALGRQLRDAEGMIPSASLPVSFCGALRPYQSAGVAWLQFLRMAGLGGVLADDMGLGKTVQTLAHLAIEQASGRLTRPVLLVCPTSLVPNWTREAARFLPGLRVLALQGPGRKQLFDRIDAHDLVLTTYPLLARDQAVLATRPWHAVVLDEAQAIRNPKAETSRVARRLEAGQRLCLTGTPLQNHLGELWALFDFLAPGFLGAESSFRKLYRTPIEKHGDARRQAALRRRVRPFLLRRTKEEVVAELPPKTEIVEPVEMEAGQRAIYEGIRLAMHAKVRTAIASRGLARAGIVILDALLKLRQACCDPRLVKVPAAQRAKAGSAKLDRLLELLDVLVGEGRRVLVFSSFTTMLALIETRLAEAGTPYLLLTGDTRDRDTPVRRFQRGEVPVFLISLKAGGVGLNLTAADTVIHYDPWWNPAAEDQATDRAHRIGQDKPVFVHRLVTLQSIEEKMEQLKQRKRALAEAVLAGEEGGALQLTEADIEALFAPD
jgi:hypothetical protein